jgi:uncharacterized protein (DUF4415 family)
MKKKFTELSVRDLQISPKGRSTKRKVKDVNIDYSDIPKFSSLELKKFKKLGRPLVGDTLRAPISIRIEEGVLKKLKSKAKKQGVRYQSLINEILKKAV